MMSSSKSPIMELEIPGSIIFTFPITAVNEAINDMSVYALLWKNIMDNYQWMVGYKLPRPMRYVTDVEISHGNLNLIYFGLIIFYFINELILITPFTI